MAGAVLLLLLTVRWAFHTAQVLAYPYEWSTMDGYFVYFGQRLVQGHGIYSDHAVPPMGFEYVPGYLLFLGPLNAIFGPAVWVERTLALVFTLGVAGLGGHIVRVRTGSYGWGAVAAALCVAPPLVGSWYLVRGIDVVVLFWGLAATAILAEGRSLSRGMIVAAALLYVFAFYCKQTALFPWAAGVMIVWWRARGSVGTFVALSLGGMVLVGVLLQVWSGGWFWNNAFATTSRNPFYFGLFWGMLRDFLPWTFGVVGGAGLAAFRRPAQAVRHPWVLFWLASIGAMGLAGKLGAAPVYFVPAYVASVILLCQIAPLWLRAVAPRPQLVIGVLAVAQFLAWFWLPLRDPDTAGARNAQQVLEAIEARPGALLVERADSFATLAGREVLWEAVQLPILHKIHGLPLDALLADLRQQRLAAVLYSGQYFNNVYWLRRTIFTYYEPLEGLQSVPISLFYGDVAYTLLVPRPPGDLPEVPLLPPDA